MYEKRAITHVPVTTGWNKMDLELSNIVKYNEGMVFMKRRLVTLALLLVLLAGLLGSASAKGSMYNKKALDNATKAALKLPVVGTFENLKKLIEMSSIRLRRYDRGMNIMFTTSGESKSLSEPVNQPSQSTSDYSSTNIQVQGVDESDLVKTDGQYIYQVSSRNVVIIRAYPSEKMSIVSKISFDERFNPTELYLDKNRLVIIGTSYNEIPFPKDGVKPDATYCPPMRSIYAVKAMVYDISKRSKPMLIKELEIEGGMVSSRRIDSKIYIVSNSYLYNYLMQNDEGMEPVYRDSTKGNNYIKIDYSNIQYFPECINPNYLIIASFDIYDKKEAKISTYLGSGEDIYVSNNNLYVALPKYEKVESTETKPRIGVPAIGIIYPIGYSPNTSIYRFKLDNGDVICSASGEVKGRTLNQFSMDEYEGYFRIATTLDDVNQKGENVSKNSVYILDMDMKVTGGIEDIAPGERIYSTRFMGDRGYMVTFKTVDPLFVLDLKDSKKPSILGALKIPGYSQYLHPYDENHIIGFGKDTVEIPNKINGSTETFTTAYYLGMKVALFDVSDVFNPIEKFSIKIGDRGTDSELLWNHKALLFSKGKGLLAFPIAVYELKNSSYQVPPPHGTFAFQGAYVYNIDMDKGFELKGKITHMTQEEYLKSGQYGYSEENMIKRILYIGENLYTVSNGKIKANRMYDLQEIGELLIK